MLRRAGRGAVLAACAAAAAAAGAAAGEAYEAPALPPVLDCASPPEAWVWTEFSDATAREGRLPPPREMPERLAPYFTRCGAAETADFYVDDTNGGKGLRLGYGRPDVDRLLRAAEHMRDSGQFGMKDHHLFETLEERPLRGRVLVYGSMRPWIEAICLAYGAESITTVEYNPPRYDHPALRTVTPAQLHEEVAAGERWDSAVSISTFDHDGLGRYGDPIAPDADLLATARVREALVPGGLLYLSVPIGRDLVVWNLLRRYGRTRLPLLLDGWRQLGEPRGWEDSRLDHDGNFRLSYEPVFVLENPGGAGEADGADAAEGAAGGRDEL